MVRYVELQIQRLTHTRHRKMSVTCAKRLRKEMYNLQRAPPDNDIFLVPEEDDIRKWKAYIRGPPDTPFAGGEGVDVSVFSPMTQMQ